jgi:hypothetical protein
VPHIPNAKDIGLPPLVADPVSAGGDSERAALPLLLNSFLHTLLAFVDVLTGTSRVPDELEAYGRQSQGDQVSYEKVKLTAVHPAPVEPGGDDDGVREPAARRAGGPRLECADAGRGDARHAHGEAVGGAAGADGAAPVVSNG